MQALVVQCLEQTISPVKAQRKMAEEKLRAAELEAGFPQVLLSVAADESGNVGVRQAAAVYFKNVVRLRWADHDERPLHAADKGAIKDGLLALMVSVPEYVRRQVSEALAIISAQDFPEQWPALLPSLVERMMAAAAAADWTLLKALLETCHAMFKGWRHEFKSDALLRKLQYVLGLLQQPLLSLYQGLVTGLHGGAGPGAEPAAQAAAVGSVERATAAKLVGCLEVATAVHHSLASQDLPEFFEDHMKEWMAYFVALLRYSHAGLRGAPDDPPGELEGLHVAVVEAVSLYTSKYEEEFAPFLADFVQLIWSMLVAAGVGPRYDQLATTAIKFLTLVATSVHHALFAQGAALKEVCERIVIPNMQLLPADEEMFEDDPTEYIRRDIEGSDADTRRRVACELVRGLCRNYEPQVGAIFGEYVSAMLAQHAAAPAASWKAKDVAIYLVTALSLRAGNTRGMGATQTSGLVDLPDFFRTAIEPELAAGAASPDELPILKADAIKFVSTFRSQLDVDAYRRVLPLLPPLLNSRHAVVHTYAAHATERLLTVRVPGAAGAPPVPKLGPAELAPHVQPLLVGLFGVLKKPGSTENDYAMKAIMRVATCAGGGQLTPLVGTLIEELKTILARVCANPSAPGFNHFLFETVAALVRDVCATNPAAVDAFEGALFPPFQQVLQMDVAEFTPYVFQIFAQLLEARPPPLSAAYRELFPPLLLPAMWERRANVPALCRLLRAYVRKGADAVGPSLPQVLGIFQKLVASKGTEGDGCLLLGALYEALPLSALTPYTQEVCRIVLTRWQHNRTRKYAHALLGSFSLVAAVHAEGGRLLVEAMDGLHPGTFSGFFSGVWLEHARTLGGVAERRIAALALARLCCETPAFSAQEPLLQQWARAMEVAVALVAHTDADADAGANGGVEDEAPDVGGEGEGVGYAAAYAKLHHAAERPSGACADVDVEAAIARAVQRACAAAPGRLMPALQQHAAAAAAAGAPSTVLQHLSAMLQRAGIDPATVQ